MSDRAVVALDVGGTTIRSGLIAEDGTVLHAAARPTVRDGRRDPGLTGTASAVRDVLEAARERDVRVTGIGAGFPEYVDVTGRLTSSEVLERTGQPADLLASLAPGLPLAVESDVRCAALAEARLGRGRGLGSFLYVSLGTGLSAAFVQDGTVWRGHRGEAIALGNLEVPASVDPGFSAGTAGGPPGTLEEYSSGAGIAARYTQGTGIKVSETRDVVRRATDGDPTALRLLTGAGRALGTALGWTVSLLDPEAVVVGGGLGVSGGLLHEELRSAYAAACLRPSPPPVRYAQLGQRSGLLGAALAVRH
ncbi:ROK family protein [Streptomyces meridianus]|uniref:ROK family protein n=1 Tax=Streptomyces meridianus TaxID=2938945 RepID=A0ABT0X3M3_9ACTN|nr:ROK family protein [Streptomyces meridianus]MCM2577133.1 ROK family protein [Streptomyces meridianus]